METFTESKSSVASPWAFRDGKEYIVSVSVHDKPRSMGILISDKITAEEWSCHYDLKYIEDLTQRTGNYKPFDTFVTMIKCAILKNSDAVALDLMSYEDLKFIKTKRHRDGIVISSDLYMNLRDRDQTSDSSLSKRKYLIVTYVAEFDNVHYPIPLHYSGPPDPQIMQNNIKKLQAEVNLLKSTNSDLRGKLSVRHFEGQPKDSSAEIFVRAPSRGALNRKRGSKNGPQTAQESAETNANVPQDKLDSKFQLTQFSTMEIEQMQKLLKSIHRLEQKIVVERAEHVEQMEKLQSENAYLREKINELQISEQALNLQISRLEARFQLQMEAATSSLPSRKSSTIKYFNNRNPFVSTDKPNRTSTKTLYSRPRSPYYPTSNRMTSFVRPPTPKSAPPPRKSANSSWSRPSSADSNRRRERPSNHSTGFQLKSSLSRSRTVSPVPRFDATSYVEKQRLRQKERNRMRMDNIRANFSKPEPERIRTPLTHFSSPSREHRQSTSAEKFRRGNGSGFYPPNASPTASRKSSNTRTSQNRSDLIRRSVSRSPPRNIEIRLAQRKLKLLQKHKLLAESQDPQFTRGRSFERRRSSRKFSTGELNKSKNAGVGRSEQVRIPRDRGTSSETTAFDLHSSASGAGVTSGHALKSDSVTWLTEEEKAKLFQRSRRDHNATYILKDIEGSLDSLQAFVNTTNQACSGFR